MSVALHVRATVQPGNKIEVTAPDLPVGADVQVIVVSAEPRSAGAGPSPRQSLLDVVEARAGQRMFQTAEEVDAYLREERASWD